MPQIEKEYLTSGKLKYVFMDFPLPMHKLASKAAESAFCAGEQGRYWQMHDRLFANQNALDAEALAKHAEALGLDMAKFRQCFESGQHAVKIKASAAEGQKAGIFGTPVFLLGYVQKDGTIKATKKITGAQPYVVFKDAIENMLSAPQRQ